MLDSINPIIRERTGKKMKNKTKQKKTKKKKKKKNKKKKKKKKKRNSSEQHKALRKHASLNIMKILQPNKENFQIKNSDIFHISAEKLDS